MIAKAIARGRAALRSFWDGDADPQGRPQSTWARRYLMIALALFALAFISIYLGASYFGLTPSSLLSHHGDDWHCDLATQAVGEHCFSDFSIAREIFARPDPWDPRVDPTNYTPIAWAPALIALAVGDNLLGGGIATTMLYLAMAGACLLIPGLWAASGRWRTDGLPVLLVTAVGAAPVISLLDRGNTLAFAIPFLLLAAIGYQRQNSAMLVLGIIFAALLKPQMLLLAVLPLAQRQYRLAVIAATSAWLGAFLSFASYPANFPGNVIGWIRTLMLYNSYQGPEIAYPYNLGFGRSVVTIYDTLFSGILPPENRRAVLDLVTSAGFALPLAVVVLGSAVLWFVAPKLPRIYSLTIAVTMTILSSSMVAIYYTAPFLVIAAVILRDPELISRTGARRGLLDEPPSVGRLLPAVTVLVTALMLAPILLATSNPQFVVGVHAEMAGRIVGLYQIWLGPILLLFFLFLLVYTPVAAIRLSRREDAAQPLGSDSGTT